MVCGKNLWARVIDLKILLTMLDAVFDDVTDKEKKWGKIARLSDIILKGNFTKDQVEIFLFDLWRFINSELKSFPAYKHYRTLFQFLSLHRYRLNGISIFQHERAWKVKRNAMVCTADGKNWKLDNNMEERVEGRRS